MEYIEIIFGGVKISEIDSFIKDVLRITEQEIINSHFYSESSGDFEYFDHLSLKDYFSIVNTANLFVKRIKIVQDFYEVMCIISSDLNSIEITCSFSDEQFHKKRTNEIKAWFQQLCSKGIITFASLSYEYDDTPIIIVSNSDKF